MNTSSDDPWLRYSVVDGTVLEVSMQEYKASSPGEGVLRVDRELAIGIINGTINPASYVVSIEDQTLVKRGTSRYIRNMWHLQDITDGTNSVELIKKEDDGVTLRRTDDHESKMIIYVTKEHDPGYLLSRHYLKRGEPQKIVFNAALPYSIYAGHHVY